MKYTIGVSAISETIQLLIVEDDKELISTLSEQLSDRGYGVSTAEDGLKAISLVNSKKFDLVILDLKLPKMDGFEVLRLIKANFPETKVIVLTAYADLKNAEKCKQHGADDVIEKPYELGDLFDAISYLFSK